MVTVSETNDVQMPNGNARFTYTMWEMLYNQQFAPYPETHDDFDPNNPDIEYPMEPNTTNEMWREELLRLRRLWTELDTGEIIGGYHIGGNVLRYVQTEDSCEQKIYVDVIVFPDERESEVYDDVYADWRDDFVEALGKEYYSEMLEITLQHLMALYPDEPSDAAEYYVLDRQRKNVVLLIDTNDHSKTHAIILEENDGVLDIYLRSWVATDGTVDNTLRLHIHDGVLQIGTDSESIPLADVNEETNNKVIDSG